MIRLAVLAAAAALLSGCETAALSVGSAGAGVAMSTGVDQTLSGITYKTFTAPLARVRRAALNSLHQMDMKVTEDHRSEDGWTISANASQRTVDIELEKLTSKSTRMRVVVEQEGKLFFKDASTATEIVLQTADTLDAQSAGEPAPHSVKKTAKRS